MRPLDRLIQPASVTQTFASLPVDAAWLAGLFEGEGCISCNRSKDGTYFYRSLHIVSTDRDVVYKAFRIANCGYVNTRPGKKPRKKQWVWKVSKWVDLKRIALEIAPFLCSRRSKKLRELLQHPPKKGVGICPTCKNALRGPAADIYVRKDGHVQCGPCARRRARGYRRIA